MTTTFTFTDWQMTTPCTPGFYWVECKDILSGNIYLQVAKVYASKRGGPADTVFIDGSNYPLSSHNNIQKWGYEPIPEPAQDPS